MYYQKNKINKNRTSVTVDFRIRTEFDDIDNITLTYNGNRLMSANDLSDPNHQNYGFVDDLEAKLNIEH